MISVHTVDGRRFDSTLTEEQAIATVRGGGDPESPAEWLWLPPSGTWVQVRHITSITPVGGAT